MICSRDLIRAGLSALLLITAAACADPVAAPPPLDRAKAALEVGDGLAAEIILRGMLEEGTREAELAAYLGEAEWRQGRIPQARHWLEAGNFSADTRVYGYRMLGRVEMSQGNLTAAAAAFDQALASGPRDPDLWVDIGRLRYLGGELDKSVEASELALQYDPNHPAALQFKAQLTRDLDGLEPALPWFEKALVRNAKNIPLKLDYAATLGDTGRAEHMLELVREVASRDRDNRRMLYLQAVLAARGGKTGLARNLLVRSEMVDAEIPAAMMLSGIVDLRNGNPASAALTFEQLVSLRPNNRRAKLLLARALYLDGRNKELLYRFEEDALAPDASPYLQDLIGRAHEGLGQREQAARFLDLARRPTRS